MSRTSKTLRRLGVPSLAAATLVAGIPAFLGSAQAAPGDTLVLAPESSTASAGTCRAFTIDVDDANGNNRNTTVTVVLTERVGAGQAAIETLDVDFCTVSAEAPVTNVSNDVNNANDTDTATFVTGNDGQVTIGLVGVPSGTTRNTTGVVDILAFQDDNFNGVANTAEAQDTGVFTVTEGGTPVTGAPNNLFQPADTFTANNAVASIDARPDTATFFPGETVNVEVVARNAQGDTLAGVRPSADVTAGNNNAAAVTCTSTDNDGVAVCSYEARTTPTPFLGNDTVVVWVNEYFDGPATGSQNENTAAPDANESTETVTRTIAARPVGTQLDLTVGDGTSARNGQEQTFQLPSTSGATETFTATVTQGDAGAPVAGVIVRFDITTAAGDFAGTESFNGGNRSIEVTTDASGIARATVNDTNAVEGETIAVSAIVRGQTGAVADDSRVTFRTVASNSAAAIDLSPATTTTQSGAFREFTATARSGNGELVVGATVTVTIEGVGRLANGARQGQFVTTNTGTVRFETTTAATESGTQTVIATLTGTTNGTTQSRTDTSTNTITAASPAPSGSATPAPSGSATPAPSNTATPTVPLTLSVAQDTITPGIQGVINIQGAPNAEVEVLAYSRPSTTYNVVRTVSLGADGRATVRILPGTNTRLFARYRAVPNSDSQSVVQNVATALSLTVVRNSRRNYTFQGRILPRRAGQLITLYRVDNNGREIITQQITTDATGTYRINRVFTGSGTFGFLTRTGQNLTNVAGVSNGGQARPTAIF